MRNLFRRREKPVEPSQPRFCKKGHKVEHGKAYCLTVGNVSTKWCCPQCLCDALEDISGIPEQDWKSGKTSSKNGA